MKNIADVNSDDILTELNNLDYADDDLQLLDDEDIRPINNKQTDDELSDFYMDYNTPKPQNVQTPPKIDLFTERPANNERPLDKYIEKANKLVPQTQTKTPTEVNTTPVGVDDYLNRATAPSIKSESTSYNSTKNTYVQPKVNPVQPKPNLTRVEPLSTTNKVNSPSINQNSINKKVEINDLNQLFSKVSSNVKGASEIVNRNAEIKKKIEERFEELRRLQEEHEENKKKDYAEINAYKDDVYSKLQQKKTDIEQDLVSLRTEQEKFDKEKKSFEIYKNNTLSDLKKLEKELKDSYESRNKNIEQVELGLVKRKEQLDNERTALAKERESVQKEREELANNLLQFNKLVDDFTNGIDNFE